MDVNKIKEYAEKWLADNSGEFRDLSDFIWENPELGLEEFSAFKAITELLKKYDFKLETGVGDMPTAFIATYGSGHPVIGINVEYDCLPGLSQQKDKPYPCPVIEGAPGQGCGHNILGTAAVKAGVAVRKAIEEFGLTGTVKLFGSPYEEASVGKPMVGKTGAYAEADAILDWHPWHYNKADYDKCNSVFVCMYHFKGKKSHGAYPWQGRSAFDAAMLFGHALELLREHIIPAGPDAAHTINYTFTNVGAEYANVVPDVTDVQLYGRFNDLAVSKDAFDRIMQAAEGAAMATGTKVEREVVTYTHNKIPNKTLAEVVHKNLEHYGAPDFTEEEQNFVKEMQKNAGLEPIGLRTDIDPFGPSETIICDTSEFTWNAPYATFWLAMGPTSGWHNWMVTACAGSSIGQKTLARSSQITTASAIDILTDSSIIEKAKAEWKERMGDNKYECLLPADHKPPIGINAATMDKYFPNRKRSVD
jgi:aminobenzoyl-glutamate utilization protein B